MSAATSTSKDRKIRVAIVGRPNAGKSTLINRLIGEDRLLTGPEAGITRDSIAVELQWRGRAFLLHDTAGLRKRAKIDEKLEKLSVADAINAVKFADVVVLLMDAGADFEEQDLRIADLVEREGRALVIGMNKWDLKETGRHAINKLREEADHWLPQVKGAGVVAVSGLTGEGLDKLMQAVVDAYEVWNKRVPTAALNRWFEEATSANPPPAVSGRRLRLNYITQAKARPPSFHHLLHARRRGAGRLQALSRQQFARGLRSAGHADPADLAREGQSVCGTEEEASANDALHRRLVWNCRNLPVRE